MKNIECAKCKDLLVERCTYIYKGRLYCIGCLLQIKDN